MAARARSTDSAASVSAYPGRVVRSLAAVAGIALSAVAIAAAPSGPLAPPSQIGPDGVPRCGPGPEALTDLSGGEGFSRFVWPAATDFHEFYFVRAMYSDGRGGGFGFRRARGGGLGDGGPAWSTDYPRADRHMVLVTKRLSNIDACEWEHPVSLADPNLRRFPFIYSLEWGEAQLTDAEAAGLGEYLEAGGLMMIDDFWGSYEWENFEREMSRVLPGRPIFDIPRDHLLFRIHYTIEGDVVQVPNVANGRWVASGDPSARTSEGDGHVPHVRGIADDSGRLMVVINWNTDLGDALEWAESPFYPLRYSTFASELFLNTIMYSMSG